MITVVNNGDSVFRVFYAAGKFVVGKVVTGYVIYSDATKSDVYAFEELGDGIYTAVIDIVKKSVGGSEKYGLVVKEDDEVKEFDTILIRV